MPQKFYWQYEVADKSPATKWWLQWFTLNLNDLIRKDEDGNVTSTVEWGSVFITESQAEYILTDEPQEPTEFQKLSISKVTADILKVFEKHNLKWGDLPKVIQTVVDSWTIGYKTAIWKVFGTFRKSLHPDYFEDHITVADILEKSKD